MKILNLTQHVATPDQVTAGVVEPSTELKSKISRLLTFDEQPTGPEIAHRAHLLTNIVRFSGCDSAMIGGAPYLMGALERQLWAREITPLYAFSVRRSVEEHQADGSVKKSQVFAHVGFIEAYKEKHEQD